jgi:hypothetical protein
MRASRRHFGKLFFALLTMGALVMSDAANADEPKKDEKKSPADKASYTEKVTVRQWADSKFLNPVKDVPAYMGEIKGATVVYTKPPAGNAETPKGSEITLADGTVYVVDKVTKAREYHINYVTKKPAEKKP